MIPMALDTDNLSDYQKFRGKCREMSEALIKDDPSLALVRGHYWDADWGPQEHWWCIKPNGEIVDPTKDQFPSKGNGLYEEFSGICTCEQCGTEVAEADVCMVGNYPCCSSECGMRLVGL